MSGPKRNADSINTIGIVVVGICGAVMVYVSITALQAFYMNDTSELQTMADYGGQDTTAKSHKAEEMRNITETSLQNPKMLTIDKALDAVIADADKSVKAGTPVDELVPGCKQNKPTEKAHRGRPELDTTLVGGCNGGKAKVQPTATPDAGSGAGSAAPAQGSGAGSAAPAQGSGAGSGSGSPAPMHSTGSPADGRQPAAGAGGAPVGKDAPKPIAPGGHAP